LAPTSERIAYRLRPGTPDDESFLWDMLIEAVCWRPGGPRPPREEVFSNPALARYVEGWGRPGDAAVVALAPDSGERIGAAWYRLMPPEDPGYGFVDSVTPEISIAVVRERRGAGVGRALLRAMMDTARSEGFAALSLAVEEDNPAISLYERAGFRKLFPTGGAWTMRVDLPGSTNPAPPKPVLTLTLLEEQLAVCRLDAAAEVPGWATAGPLFSVTRTADELSVVCPEGLVPDGVKCEKGWRVFELEGPFEFSEVGILSAVAAPLAEAGVGIFAVSTFDTDYVLVKEERVGVAADALQGQGHEVRGLPAKEV
jgi:ribosomal protein S18 acetylase RimI-like enzyme